MSCRFTECGRRWFVLAAVGGLAVIGSLWFGAGVAAAHVTVHPSTVAAGTDDFELHFYVPNERDDANTVRLQLFLPSSPPLPEVDVLPVPGWAAHVTTVVLHQPVETDDGPIDTAVTGIDLTATSGGTPPGQFEDFTLLVGAGPTRPGTVVFKALQTYSNGDIVRWIELPTAQFPVPQYPAPILTVTPSAHTAVATPTAPTGSSSNSQTLAVIALIVAVIAVVLGALALWRRRRPASVPLDAGGPAGE